MRPLHIPDARGVHRQNGQIQLVIQKFFDNINGTALFNLQTDIRIFLPEFAKQKRQQKTSDLQRNPKADMIFLPHEII